MRREQTEGEPIMPKLKTHSASKKRFNLTKTGKVKCAKAKKTTKRTRRLRAGGYVDKTLSATVRKMIPYK